MVRFSRDKRRFRQAVAAAAAYAFVLYGILASVLATQMVAAEALPGAEICSGVAASADGKTQHLPGQHHIHVNCGACAFPALGGPLPDGTAAVPVAYSAVPAFFVAQQSEARTAARHNPRQSQGPPQNV